MHLDSACEESNSSDAEFWNYLEKNPEVSKPPPIAIRANVKLNNLRPSEKDRYEKTITNIRDSKEEEIRSLKIQIRNQTRKELLDSVNEMKEKIKKESMHIEESFINSLAIIKKKDFEILQLRKKLEQQEILITNMRITLEKNYKCRDKNDEIYGENNEEGEMESRKLEIEGYRIQLNTQREVNDALRNDIEYHKEENRKLNDENNDLKIKVAENQYLIENFSNYQIEKLIKERDEIDNLFREYKSETEKELEARDILNKRQIQMISSLQQELKDAKMIINTPRLHQKALDRLKDLAEKNEELERKKQMIKLRKEEKGKISQSISKSMTRYSYKEYKAFDIQDSKSTFMNSRTSSITPRIGFYKNKTQKVNSFIEKSSFSLKKSILHPYISPLKIEKFK